MKTHITRRITALLALVASVFAGCIGLTVHATPAGALGDTNSAVAISGTPTAKGYTLFARDGGIFNFGDSKFYGSMGGKPLAAPIVGGATTPTGKGYTLVASDGGIFNFGDSHFYGSMGGKPLAKPIVGMAATPTGNGYTLVASDGGIFNFGDSHFYGSMGGKPLAKPIVGMAATPTGNGYTLVASDGGIFNFGDSHFYGSMGGKPLAKPIVGMAATPTGNGYTLVASDGGIFNFGDSHFYGSMGGKPLAKPIVGIATTPTGNGYTLVASDGGIFNFGDSHFYGSAANIGGETAQPGDLVTLQQLRDIYGAQVPDTQAVRDGFPTLAREMYAAGIRSSRQKAAFLATILNESGFRYDALQGGRSTYRGRGFIQLTGSSNYASAAKAFNAPIDSSPELARSLTWSAPIATWYWTGRTYSHLHANEWADRLDMGRVDAIIGYARSAAEDAERCSAFRNALRYFTGTVPAGINCVRP